MIWIVKHKTVPFCSDQCYIRFTLHPTVNPPSQVSEKFAALQISADLSPRTDVSVVRARLFGICCFLKSPSPCIGIITWRRFKSFSLTRGRCLVQAGRSAFDSDCRFFDTKKLSRATSAHLSNVHATALSHLRRSTGPKN